MEEALKKLPDYRNAVPDRHRCPYCKNAGYEIVYEYHPEVYGPNGAPIEYTIPCRACNGKRPHYDRENKSRLNLPYDAFLSAFNPMAYHDKNGKPIDFSNTMKFIRGYIEKYQKIQDKSRIKGLYIYSEKRGTGKTFLASIICNEIYSRYQLMPVYITENGLLDELEKSVSAYSIKPKDVIRKSQLLFIDDMWQKKSGREWVTDELFDIINYRYTEGLCTIITSNVPLDTKDYNLSKIIDARIAGRINEMCALIKMPDCEIRKEKKREDGLELAKLLQEE